MTYLANSLLIMLKKCATYVILLIPTDPSFHLTPIIGCKTTSGSETKENKKILYAAAETIKKK